MKGQPSRRGAARRLPYPVFIAYADIPAARHAITRVHALIQTPEEERELMPMLWRFDQLDQPRWREMALREASRAVTIVLAIGASSTLTPGVEAWLTALTRQQSGRAISAVVLLGDEAWTICLQQTAVASPSQWSQLTPHSGASEPIVATRQTRSAPAPDAEIVRAA
jgi:hypothetical protein